MLRRSLLLFALCGIFNFTSAVAQDPCPIAPAALSTKLYCAIPNALHISGAEASFFNAPLGTQLGQLPLATPASGFIYSFDKAKGVYTTTNESFGPILTERSETIGKYKLYVGFTYQHFGFSTIDGTSLKNVPIVLTGFQSGVGVVYSETNNRFDTKADQYAIFGTFGLTDRIDVSVAIPFERVSMGVSVQGTEFATGGRTQPIPLTFTHGDASGIGDVVLALKGTAWRGSHLGLALGAEVRLPSGDALNFLGSGTVGFKPYFTLSRRGKFSPHVNGGYQWNGNSVLARRCPATGCTAANPGEEHRLPTNAFYAVGADWGVAKRLTVVADFLGQRFFDSPRVSQPVSIPIAVHPGLSFPSIVAERGPFSVNNLSLGLKVNPWRQLLITGNLLVKLNDSGLRSTVVPLVGLSYSFGD
jgi:Putative MetA-pathway of phenol degradation